MKFLTIIPFAFWIIALFLIFAVCAFGLNGFVIAVALALVIAVAHDIC